MDYLVARSLKPAIVIDNARLMDGVLATRDKVSGMIVSSFWHRNTSLTLNWVIPAFTSLQGLMDFTIS